MKYNSSGPMNLSLTTPAHVHTSVAALSVAPRPSSRTSACETTTSSRLLPILDHERLAQSGAVRARRIPCSALPSDPISPVDIGVQITPHESLLKNTAGTVWGFLETVLSSPDASSPLQALSEATTSIQGVSSALTSALADLSDSAHNASSTIIQSEQAMQSMRESTANVWDSLQASFSAQGLPELSSLFQATSLPVSPGEIFGSLQNASGQELSLSSMALFNGTFSETEAIIIATTAAAVITMATLTASFSEKSFPITATDSELPSEYDGESIYRYWMQQPVTLMQRAVETAVLAIGFLVGVQFDIIRGKEKENEKKRARMLRQIVDRLGPAYIKVAQALSTRVDLLSPAYFEEITLLQDQVKPFPTEEAMAILEVYRGTLRSTGAEVAIKVQRPGVLELVALDLVLGRKYVEIAGALFPSSVRSADILPVLDEWAFKLYNELDYRREAAVMRRFAGDLSGLNGIMVPLAFPEATTRRILCTEWIEGEKLSESNEADVRVLCTTLLNAYLIQLLDTGLLHADPHPGNLLRTKDGKICILDYGLVTEVPPKFRVHILEYMSHLSLKDWDAVGQDFVNLQFIAPGSKHPNEVPGLMASVGALLEILMAGGGAKNLEQMQNKELVDMVGLDPAELEDAGFMDGFASVLDNLANPDVDAVANSKDRERAAKIKALNEQVKFQLPPYFVLILRAFSVIEGIALKADPNYSIITETFPYLSKRLLTDDSEEIRVALRKVLYGDGKRMNMERFQALFNSLQSFSTDGLSTEPAAPENGASANGSALATASQGPALDKNVVLALQSILNTNGQSYIQQLVVEEMAATVDSLSRNAAVTLLQRALNSSLSTATLNLIDRLGPLRPIIFPLPLPVEIISQLGNVVTLTEDDRTSIRNVEIMWSFLQPSLQQQVGSQQLQLSLLRSFVASVQDLPRDTRRQLAAGSLRTSQMVLEQVMQRTVSRFTQDIASVQSQASYMGTILGQPSAVPAGASSNSVSKA